MTVCLMYHDLFDPADADAVGMPGPVAARYKHTVAEFAAHLDAVTATGCPVGLVREDQPLPKVALTFDDGGSSAPLIAQMLEARGWRGHFFVTTSRIGTPGFMSADEIRRLVADGHVVGSHSHDHPRYMGRLSRAEIDEEWRRSGDELERILGQRPRVAALPGGFLSRSVIASAAGCGYRILMTSEPSARPRRAGDLTHLGRYTIWRTTPPAIAAAYVEGSPVPRARLWLEWQIKQVAKRTLPGAYRSMQRLRARAA